jgi:hypothetical protein
MVIRCALLCLLLSVPLSGQEQPKMKRIDWALLAADAGTRSLDVYSTRRMLDRGYQEQFLPDAIAQHNATMAAYSGAVVVGNYFISRRIARHHPRLPRLYLLADVLQNGYFAVHNLTLPEQR